MLLSFCSLRTGRPEFTAAKARMFAIKQEPPGPGSVVVWNGRGALTSCHDKCQPWFPNTRAAYNHVSRTGSKCAPSKGSVKENMIDAFNMFEIENVDGQLVRG